MSSQSYTVGKGETFSLPLTYKNADGTPKDLTGHTLVFKVLTPNDPAASPILSITPTTDSQGNINITVPASTTTGIPEGEYVYILIDTHDSGTVDWLLRDRWFITEASSISDE